MYLVLLLDNANFKTKLILTIKAKTIYLVIMSFGMFIFILNCDVINYC